MEVLDVDRCADCGQPFQVGLFTKSWLACGCADTLGHRTLHCLRDGCGGTTYDPPHVIQTGPTADYA